MEEVPIRPSRKETTNVSALENNARLAPTSYVGCPPPRRHQSRHGPGNREWTRRIDAPDADRLRLVCPCGGVDGRCGSASPALYPGGDQDASPGLGEHGRRNDRIYGDAHDQRTLMESWSTGGWVTIESRCGAARFTMSGGR